MSVNTYKFEENVIGIEMEVTSDGIRFIPRFKSHKKAVKGYTVPSNTYNCIKIDGDGMLELAC